MCGIALLVYDPSLHLEGPEKDKYDIIWKNMCSMCAPRGPDWSDSIDITLDRDAYGKGHKLSAYASVLHLRGSDGLDSLTQQPHVGADGSVFLWNGEIFEGMSIEPHENDGSRLFKQIQDNRMNTSTVAEIMSQLEGPYAFAYFDKPTQILYFARDPLGRRSLLIHLPSTSEPFFALCSASNKGLCDGFEEISTAVVFSISLKGRSILEGSSSLECIPRGESMFTGLMKLNCDIPPDYSEPISAQQIDTFIEKLDQCVRIRVSNIPRNATDSTQPLRSRLGVLFSGGIDCSVLAFLADRHIPPDEPIDLLNVAFENPRTLGAPKKNDIQEERARRKQSKKSNKDGVIDAAADGQPAVVQETKQPGPYDVPDRLTGLEEVEELRRLCPHRRWNFVCVDVPYEECKREEHKIIELMYPSNTVMDLSLALALYFASRGKGWLSPSSAAGGQKEYECPAKVLLSGLGSDELLGGYSRHRHAYSRGGWSTLIEELQLDLDRLPTRNLGRDDRVISAHGRESRYPFLSLSLVSYLAQLPVHTKVDPRLASKEGGMGDKTLLRLAAARLGLELASRRAKRAMQFGSRSARMESGSDKKGHVLLE